MDVRVWWEGWLEGEGAFVLKEQGRLVTQSIRCHARGLSLFNFSLERHE